MHISGKQISIALNTSNQILNYQKLFQKSKTSCMESSWNRRSWKYESSSINQPEILQFVLRLTWLRCVRLSRPAEHEYPIKAANANETVIWGDVIQQGKHSHNPTLTLSPVWQSAWTPLCGKKFRACWFQPRNKWIQDYVYPFIPATMDENLSIVLHATAPPISWDVRAPKPSESRQRTARQSMKRRRKTTHGCGDYSFKKPTKWPRLPRGQIVCVHWSKYFA